MNPKVILVFFLWWIPSLATSQVIFTNLNSGPLVNVVLSGNGWVTGKILGATNQLFIPEGKQLLIHGINYFNDYSEDMAFVRAKLGQDTKREIARVGVNQPFSLVWDGPVMGPINIEYGLDEIGTFNTDSAGLESIQKTGNESLPKCEFILEITDDPFQSSSSSLIPSTSVVIPANAVGDVDVLLEQSTDMITWTQCLPGTYNASTQKRFFRVRAVEK